jgi:hypothetical protein
MLCCGFTVEATSYVQHGPMVTPSFCMLVRQLWGMGCWEGVRRATCTLVQVVADVILALCVT